MKLTQMKYFSSACHLGSITRAAEQLHISQPAITAAIQALENEMGVLLLNRGKRTVAPTPDGEVFLKRCDAILADVDSLTADFQRLSQGHNTISVGVPPMIGFFLFPQIFAGFTTNHPEIHVKLMETGSDTARDLVKNGELELAIIAMGESVPAGLDHQILVQTQMMYCVSQENRLAQREYVELIDVVEEPLIRFTSGHYHQEVLRSRLANERLVPNVLFYSNQLLTIKSFLRKNLAGAFLLPQAIEPNEPIAALPLRNPLWINIAAVWRKDVFITKEAQQFIRFIKSSFEHLDDA